MPWSGVRVPGTPQAGDRFGASLLLGSMDLPEREGDEIAMGLVVGAPGDTLAGRDGAGSVTVIQEVFHSAAVLSQDSVGVPGTPETGDQVGASLALRPVVKGAVGSAGDPADDLQRLRHR